MIPTLDIPRLFDDLEAMTCGRPVRQAIVRRISVKGETVFSRETYMAPFGSAVTSKSLLPTPLSYDPKRVRVGSGRRIIEGD